MIRFVFVVIVFFTGCISVYERSANGEMHSQVKNLSQLCYIFKDSRANGTEKDLIYSQTTIKHWLFTEQQVVTNTLPCKLFIKDEDSYYDRMSLIFVGSNQHCFVQSLQIMLNAEFSTYVLDSFDVKDVILIGHEIGFEFDDYFKIMHHLAWIEEIIDYEVIKNNPESKDASFERLHYLEKKHSSVDLFNYENTYLYIFPNALCKILYDRKNNLVAILYPEAYGTFKTLVLDSRIKDDDFELDMSTFIQILKKYSRQMDIKASDMDIYT